MILILIVSKPKNRFTYDTIERMGPGKALSETRDTTERVFPAIISALCDASQDVRYWGRKTISLLSQHSEFNRLAERHLSANDARQVIDETTKVSYYQLSQDYKNIERDWASNLGIKTSVNCKIVEAFPIFGLYT